MASGAILHFLPSDAGTGSKYGVDTPPDTSLILLGVGLKRTCIDPCSGRVFGKLASLAVPTRSRYITALGVALEEQLECVVVDSEGTAAKCIEVWLEGRRVACDMG